MIERRFPVLVIGRLTVADLQREAVSVLVLSVPWALLAPHEARVQADWGHSLDFLATDRGGLMAHELVAILEGREARLMPRAESNARLLDLMAAGITEPAAPVGFNINESVWVRLKDVGRLILRRRHDELRERVPSIGPYEPPKLYPGGYARFQLWDLMQTFGPHVSLGREPPFDTVILLAEPGSPKRLAERGDSAPIGQSAGAPK